MRNRSQKKWKNKKLLHIIIALYQDPPCFFNGSPINKYQTHTVLNVPSECIYFACRPRAHHFKAIDALNFKLNLIICIGTIQVTPFNQRWALTNCVVRITPGQGVDYDRNWMRPTKRWERIREMVSSYAPTCWGRVDNNDASLCLFPLFTWFQITTTPQENIERWIDW